MSVRASAKDVQLLEMANGYTHDHLLLNTALDGFAWPKVNSGASRQRGPRPTAAPPLMNLCLQAPNAFEKPEPRKGKINWLGRGSPQDGCKGAPRKSYCQGVRVRLSVAHDVTSPPLLQDPKDRLSRLRTGGNRRGTCSCSFTVPVFTGRDIGCTIGGEVARQPALRKIAGGR